MHWCACNDEHGYLYKVCDNYWQKNNKQNKYGTSKHKEVDGVGVGGSPVQQG
jgi:hypothetical protein